MKLDVRTKVLLLIFANLAFLFRVGGWLEIAILLSLALLLWSQGRGRAALLYLFYFSLAWLLDFFLLPYLAFPGLRILLTFATAGRFLLPSFMAAGLLLATSSAYELIHGLRKWRLPESLLLTMAVLLRFLPAIKTDADLIRSSLRLRGIFLRRWDMLLRPWTYFEYFMIPLLMSLLRTVQELTMASLTKGLALKRGASETFVSRFRLIDWSVCLWMSVLLVWMIAL